MQRAQAHVTRPFDTAGQMGKRDIKVCGRVGIPQRRGGPDCGGVLIGQDAGLNFRVQSVMTLGTSVSGFSEVVGAFLCGGVTRRSAVLYRFAKHR